jgi:hypothetical protein
MQVELPHEEFDKSLQWRRKEIGDYNGAFFDSQEANLYVSTSSCKELEGDDFEKEYYAPDESASLEEYWWPEECLHNVKNFKKKKTL